MAIGCVSRSMSSAGHGHVVGHGHGHGHWLGHGPWPWPWPWPLAMAIGCVSRSMSSAFCHQFHFSQALMAPLWIVQIDFASIFIFQFSAFEPKLENWKLKNENWCKTDLNYLNLYLWFWGFLGFGATASKPLQKDKSILRHFSFFNFQFWSRRSKIEKWKMKIDAKSI